MRRGLTTAAIILMMTFSMVAGDAYLEKAKKLVKRIIITDGHVDVPYRLENKWEDIGFKTESGHFDYPRAKAGGMDAPFMSIYIPASLEEKGGSKALADKLIGIVNGIIKKHPDKYARANTPDQVRKNFKKGLISLPMGMENGSPIEGDLKNVKYFYDKGIRYITLAHSKDNHICDSSYDESHKWKGLSPFGKKMIPEMNRVGIMVDVSHISDDAFFQVMDISKVPVIASHSSCRHFTPGFERNMSDDMIKLLAKKGGVIQINFGSYFLTSEYQQKAEKGRKVIGKFMKKNNLKWSDPKTRAFIDTYRKDNPTVKTSMADLVAHIHHVVKLVGIDYVGLGSDFDGVGDLPVGMDDVSGLPNLIAALLKKGYSEKDIEKICSGNVFRVWQAVEDYAKNHAKAGGSL